MVTKEIIVLGYLLSIIIIVRLKAFIDYKINIST